MTKEEADLAQRYNVGVVIKRPGYDGKIYYISEFIRWRDPRLSDKFSYSCWVENQNEPRRGAVKVDIYQLDIMPGWKQFIESKLKERTEQQAVTNLKKQLKN